MLSEGTGMERIGPACGVPANPHRREPEVQRSLVLAAQTHLGSDSSELAEMTRESPRKTGLTFGNHIRLR